MTLKGLTWPDIKKMFRPGHVFSVSFVLLIEMEAKEFKNTILPLRPRLLGYAHQLTDAPEDAEDAVQEVMLKLWNLRDELGQYRSIEAFARTMTHHACMDIKRRRKFEYPAQADGRQTDIPVTLSEHLQEIKDEVRLVKEIIKALPPLQRHIMHMKDIEGYENEEIAQITGCSPEAVRKNLSRARKKVRATYLMIVGQRRMTH